MCDLLYQGEKCDPAIGQPRLLLPWTVWSQTPLEPTYPPSIFLFHYLLNSSSIYPHNDIFLQTYPTYPPSYLPPHDDIPYVMYRPYKQQFAAYNPSLLVYIPSLASSRSWRTTPTSWSKTEPSQQQVLAYKTWCTSPAQPAAVHGVQPQPCGVQPQPSQQQFVAYSPF